MTILTQKAQNENKLIHLTDRFVKKFQIGFLLKKSNTNKEKGIPCIQIFKILLMLVFTGKNLFMNMESEDSSAIPFGKDVMYRFLNSTAINWSKFLYLLSSNVINGQVADLTDKSRVNAFVVDDSFYSRTRSKSVELLSWVKDHADKGRNKKGFRMLTLGWTDGNSFIPVSFNLLSSNNEKSRVNEANPKMDKRSNGHKRRENAVLSSPEATIMMLKSAIKQGIDAKYVLFDSWFSYPSTIIKIAALKLHTIAMLKNTTKVHYLFNGEQQTLKSIYSKIKKRPGRAKYLASVMVDIHDKDGITMPAKIVFVRNRNDKSQWLALISTDVNLDESEIIRIYGKRWDIEVFFKMCKSYLKLAKEFQGRSYDMMVAHTTVVFSRYIMLSVENRESTDIRTIGPLFFQCCDELEDIKFIESLQLIMDAFKSALESKLFMSREKINEVLDCFIAALPSYIKDKMLFYSCES